MVTWILGWRTAGEPTTTLTNGINAVTTGIILGDVSQFPDAGTNFIKIDKKKFHTQVYLVMNLQVLQEKLEEQQLQLTVVEQLLQVQQTLLHGVKLHQVT